MSSNEFCADKQIDARFKIQGYEQFLKDNETKKFNKICMTEVINADHSISTFGEAEYFKTCSDILNMGNDAYKQMGIDHLIHVYIHSYKTFIAVANDDMSDDDFFNLMKINHAFGDNIVNRALSALYANRTKQNNFIVENNEIEALAMEARENVVYFKLLNYAINNDKVVPFYQGIYNNKTNKIRKYEALMRIYDQNGKICPPGMFLDAAKELKLYLPLSKIIIDKALKDFEDKESELGFNISLLDIQSEEFSGWILERLKKHPKPSNVIIEFVETENYNKGNELFLFLEEARKIGCKIAVDDFGVGFATFTSIISLKPDIIKIDGDIIKTLVTSNDNRIILDTISYMADLVGAKTTAEFVENSEIQEILMKYDIDFSQGYHFAKPEPYENLDIV